MQRQSTPDYHAALDYYTELFTGVPSSRGYYPSFATFDIAGNSRSTHLKDIKRTVWDKSKKSIDNCVQSRWLEIDECCDATCYGASFCNVSAKMSTSIYLSSKSFHTQSKTLLKSWKCFYVNFKKRVVQSSQYRV